jgi:uncharacterized phiE125 gp8 family phage protein
MIVGAYVMQRIVVQSAEIGEAALADLKLWLGITRTSEDVLLTDLLRAALDLCEAFTGQVPLLQAVEEVLPARAGVHGLATRPARTITAVEVIGADGTRTPLAPTDSTAEITACGTASLRVHVPVEGRGLAVRVTAGIAADWASLPAALRQGIIRLAAHEYRERGGDPQVRAAPPTSVTALWQPWRLMRLA